MKKQVVMYECSKCKARGEMPDKINCGCDPDKRKIFTYMIDVVESPEKEDFDDEN